MLILAILNGIYYLKINISNSYIIHHPSYNSLCIIYISLYALTIVYFIIKFDVSLSILFRPLCEKL